MPIDPTRKHHQKEFVLRWQWWHEPITEIVPSQLSNLSILKARWHFSTLPGWLGQNRIIDEAQHESQNTLSLRNTMEQIRAHGTCA